MERFAEFNGLLNNKLGGGGWSASLYFLLN